ncbi:MAG: hypothetical protein MR272_04890 [Pseudoflavonifractor sp.]|nr:hypothetical protein [Pseudoflavonifractor sp.]MDY3020131.1 hypothetical protein [Oscillospiraceae bacterium]
MVEFQVVLFMALSLVLPLLPLIALLACLIPFFMAFMERHACGPSK